MKYTWYKHVRNRETLRVHEVREGIRYPLTLALFQKRIEGDDSLLELASLRFSESNLGTECYAETIDELERLLRFKPRPETVVSVHMDRGIDLFDEGDRKKVLQFAAEFRHEVYGLVVHDQPEIADRFADYIDVLHRLESVLKPLGDGPYLFIEYAVGMEPDHFVELFRETRHLGRVKCCIDTGHTGLRHVRKLYAEKHPGQDACLLEAFQDDLPLIIKDVQDTVAAGIDPVLYLISEIGSLGGPLHFHLHDGHPLHAGPFGVSDHMSFIDRVPIPFEYEGEKSLPLMFGPSGLERIVKESLSMLPSEKVSFSLEIHPSEGRLGLGNASRLFEHWADKGNAERMNFWLSVLTANHKLLREAFRNFIEKR
jgi:hypothetical protein